MKEQNWIFTICYWPKDGQNFRRRAIVVPARASTVEAALHLAGVPEVVRVEIRRETIVRKFVERVLDPEAYGYHVPRPPTLSADGQDDPCWIVNIGSIQAVLS